MLGIGEKLGLKIYGLNRGMVASREWSLWGILLYLVLESITFRNNLPRFLALVLSNQLEGRP